MSEIKKALRFIYKTILTGLVYLLPVVVILIVLFKILFYLIELINPTLSWINSLFGIYGSRNWEGVILITLFFFIGGLLLKIRKLKRIIGHWEDKILVLFPGYRLVKSIARNHKTSEDILMKPAFYKDNDNWQPCFLVETNGNLSTIYIPEAPNVNTGSIVVTSSDKIFLPSITNLQMTLMIRDYGLSAIDLINRELKKSLADIPAIDS